MFAASLSRMKPFTFFPTALLVSLAGLLLDLLTPLGLATWMIQLVVVWAAGHRAARRDLLVVAGVCSAFVIAGLWLSPQSDAPFWVAAINRTIAVAVVWLFVYSALSRKASEAARARAEAELGKSNSQLRVLSGLLPICSACKKIRNESGDWEPLEVYIRGRSEAEFTHGLCDECMQRLCAQFAPKK